MSDIQNPEPQQPESQIPQDPVQQVPEVSEAVVNVGDSSAGGWRSRRTRSIIAVVAVLVLAGVILGIRNHLAKGQQNIALKQANVEITSSGFSPADLQVAPGTEVTWQNDTNDTQAVGATPFPTHTSLPGLASGQLAPHQSFSYVFGSTGTWQYQNDMMPLNHGSVVVKN